LLFGGTWFLELLLTDKVILLNFSARVLFGLLPRTHFLEAFLHHFVHNTQVDSMVSSGKGLRIEVGHFLRA
jgi:hypothetical protein